MFSTRCLRVKNDKSPLRSRCKAKPMVNSILCKDCDEHSKHNEIYVLMHNDVSKKFNIPFKNQLCVKIDLRNSVKKPQNKTDGEKFIKTNKDKLMKNLNNITMKKLEELHDMLKLNIWNVFSKKGNITEYALRYHISMEIINRLFILNKGQ